MAVRILEKTKDMLKIEMDDLTLVNLLNERLWKQRINYSAYAIDHPYLSRPILTIKSKFPNKSLMNAAQSIIEDAKELKKKAARA